MGTVSGLRTRRYHGLLVVAGDTPAARQLGLASLDPVRDPAVRRAGAARHARVGRPARSTRAGTSCWSASTWSTACPAGGGGSATSCSSGSWPWRTAGPAWPWCTGCSPAARSAWRWRRCAPGGTRTASGAPTGRRRRSTPVADGVRGRGRVPAGRARLARRRASGGAACTTARRPRAGCTADEDLWYAGRFAAELPRPGDDGWRCRAWAGDLRRREPPPADRGGRGGPPAQPARWRPRRGRPTTSHATLALAADAFVVRTAGGTGRGRRLPVVRRLVAGHDDRRTRGCSWRTGRADEGRELLRAYAATLSEGMLANTADTGSVRVQHRRRHAVVPARGRAGTSPPPATPTSPPSCCPALRDGGRRTTWPAPGTASVDPADGLLRQGAAGRGADLDGRPGRRGAGDPAGRQAGRGQRAVGQRAGRRRRAVRTRSGRTPVAAPSAHAAGRWRRSGAASRPRSRLAATTCVDGPGRRRRDALRPEPVAGLVAAVRAAARRTPAVLRPVGAALLTPLGPAQPGAGLARLPRPRTGAARRERDARLPPGHGLAVADRPVRGRLAPARNGRPRTTRSCSRADRRRILAEFGLGSVSETADGTGAARRHRLPVPGLVGRRAAAGPPDS